ncbi:HutD family protein [Rhizobium sp. BK376]|uniref:HutD/Ves family protein n=1 Tax=Rhizobium sp. BK376 TaxID=2512149 RepID=UPI001FDF4C0F|nr:HutD family protein [Rhizobium sp. BK376]
MPRMTHLRAQDYRRMPWKNGGGETVEIIVSPEGAGLADFDWRISMATVATDGPFSIFPDTDRTLSILEGAGMALSIEGHDPILLTRDSVPLPFPADAVTSATLADGPITDLNVMTRRGKISHQVERLAVETTGEIRLEAETALILVDRGEIEITVGADRSRLAARDCLVVQGATEEAVALSGQGTIYIIRLHKI